MSEPKVAGTGPVEVTLEPGVYYFCMCGRSQNQPFCDGSHKGSEFRPRRFVVETREDLLLCLCKRTEDPPFCDGNHSLLEPSDTDPQSG